MWIVANPDLNAISYSSRTRLDGTKSELLIEPESFEVLTMEEIVDWRLSPRFAEDEESGRIEVYETDEMPKSKTQIPSGLKPKQQYDHIVAREVCFSEDQATQLARINLFRAEPDTGRDWAENADVTYLKTRHLEMLLAAEWYLTKYIEKRTRNQNARLRAIRRQVKTIKALV
jgi:hypothetical protein